MKLQFQKINRSAFSAAFTVVEMILAGSIATIALGALLSLILQLAKEQRYGLADGSVHAQAGLIQDRVSQLLRSMSASESVLYADPVTGSPGLFRRIIVARGQSPAFPREEVYFDPAKFQLIHDPNRKISGNEFSLCKSNTMTILRDVYFHPSLKVGNMPDSTTLNVVMKFDDNGYPMRRDSQGRIRKMCVNRYFTVKLRN